MARNVGLLLLAAAAAPAAIAAGVGCTAEDDCLNQPTAYRCLPTSDGSGSPCTLDYSFNETGHCACQPQACVLLTTAPKTTLKQLLVIGDSISDGYLTSLTTALAASWEVTHAPSFSSSNNNDNANWHARCNIGWLGTNASRWDAVSVNAGLHDMAQPDNEHLNASNYQSRLQVALGQLVATLPARTKIIWARTTPVPTNPAPNCVLLPGRLEGAFEGVHDLLALYCHIEVVGRNILYVLVGCKQLVNSLLSIAPIRGCS